ncbi:conserved Plasmodium protein, unknown function [Plasmodium ovale wallikeri]|uniref:Uncharacterized protein n=1 Tax=Plasmodium ovale wallikeri TaxID=864142 RepID=A0A1A8YK35_PLAOA|nr:conserved Plasmodium protein, unknown function [Plasmodium ovale wallikeri]
MGICSFMPTFLHVHSLVSILLKGEIEDANTLWSQALKQCIKYSMRGYPTRKNRDMQLSLRLNLSLYHLKKKEYVDCINQCNIILENIINVNDMLSYYENFTDCEKGTGKTTETGEATENGEATETGEATENGEATETGEATANGEGKETDPDAEEDCATDNGRYIVKRDTLTKIFLRRATSFLCLHEAGPAKWGGTRSGKENEIRRNRLRTKAERDVQKNVSSENTHQEYGRRAERNTPKRRNRGGVPWVANHVKSMKSMKIVNSVKSIKLVRTCPWQQHSHAAIPTDSIPRVCVYVFPRLSSNLVTAQKGHIYAHLLKYELSTHPSYEKKKKNLCIESLGLSSLLNLFCEIMQVGGSIYSVKRQIRN